MCACVLDVCEFVCARAFCEERNMRVPKSPFEQLSSLSMVQFPSHTRDRNTKGGKKEDNFLSFDVENDRHELIAGRHEKKILDSFFIWWSRKTVFICLSEKKVVFCLFRETLNSLLLEKTHTPKALRRERRKDERESLGRKAFVGEKKKKKKKRFALS